MKRLGVLVIIMQWITMPCAANPARPLYVPTAPSSVHPEQVDLEQDVVEFEFRQFKIPFQIDRNLLPNVRAVRLFVSEDRGKSWKLVEERTPNETVFVFRAAHDGLLWFAVQSIQAEGNRPAQLKDLTANLKVYVNSEKRPLLRVHRVPIQP